MKKIIITSAFFVLSFASVFSQNLAGKRIISGNVSLNLISLGNEPKNSSFGSTSNSNFTLGVTFLSGKVRENNTYTAYGFNVNTSNNSNDGNGATKSQSYSLVQLFSLENLLRFSTNFILLQIQTLEFWVVLEVQALMVLPIQILILVGLVCEPIFLRSILFIK